MLNDIISVKDNIVFNRNKKEFPWFECKKNWGGGVSDSWLDVRKRGGGVTQMRTECNRGGGGV